MQTCCKSTEIKWEENVLILSAFNTFLIDLVSDSFDFILYTIETWVLSRKSSKWSVLFGPDTNAP